MRYGHTREGQTSACAPQRPAALRQFLAVTDRMSISSKAVRSAIEIRFHNIAGQLYITGRPPRRRDWYANLLAHPEFTLHLKQSIHADLPARATPVLDQAPRNKRGHSLKMTAWKLGRWARACRS